MKKRKVVLVIGLSLFVLYCSAIKKSEEDSVKVKGKHELGLGAGYIYDTKTTRGTVNYKYVRGNYAGRFQFYGLTSSYHGEGGYDPYNASQYYMSFYDKSGFGLKSGIERRHKANCFLWFYGFDVNYEKVVENTAIDIADIEFNTVYDDYRFKNNEHKSVSASSQKIGLTTFIGLSVPIGTHFLLSAQIASENSSSSGNTITSGHAYSNLRTIHVSRFVNEVTSEINLLYQF